MAMKDKIKIYKINKDTVTFVQNYIRDEDEYGSTHHYLGSKVEIPYSGPDEYFIEDIKFDGWYYAIAPGGSVDSHYKKNLELKNLDHVGWLSGKEYDFDFPKKSPSILELAPMDVVKVKDKCKVRDHLLNVIELEPGEEYIIQSFDYLLKYCNIKLRRVSDNNAFVFTYVAELPVEKIGKLIIKEKIKYGA